ncbi:MAG TPA: sucrase ferredoxin [Propionibacteriaceae bacterium]|nr:sucrase ferredoxin [Propionibacteriaceae bacterium]
MTPSAGTPELTCSRWSVDLGEPLAGTASTTRGYLVIEHSGPWGRNALSDSRLGHDVAATLDAQLSRLGLSPLLMRRPGRSRDREHRTGRQVFASVLEPTPVTVAFRVAGAAELLELDWTAAGSESIERIHPDAVGVTHPLALICAHAKRDRCCAALGRPLATYLHQQLAAENLAAATGYEPVWECSHLGGHRLAPTAVMLPAGVVYGRLDPLSLSAAYDAARSQAVLPPLMRGMARYRRAVQAAEIAVREEAGIDQVAFPRLISSRRDGQCTLAVFADEQQQRWQVRVSEQPVRVPRPESCGKAPASPTVCTVEAISRLPTTRIEI